MRCQTNKLLRTTNRILICQESIFSFKTQSVTLLLKSLFKNQIYYVHHLNLSEVCFILHSGVLTNLLKVCYSINQSYPAAGEQMLFDSKQCLCPPGNLVHCRPRAFLLSRRPIFVASYSFLGILLSLVLCTRPKPFHSEFRL